MTRTSNLSLATAVILLLVMTAMEVEAIRLDAESRAAVSKQMVNKSSENVFKASGDSLGETKRSVAAKEVRAAAHELPEVHEDYYGPSDHKPRHH